MIPLLIISNNSKSTQDYIEKYKSSNQFYEILPSTKEYSINDIKNVIREIKIYFQKTRVYFFPNFENSSLPAQNSFLKILEEPPNNVQFILSCHNANSLLPTIISRTKIIKLSKKNELILDKNVQTELRELISGKSLHIFNSTTFNQIKRENIFNLFDQMIYFFHEKLSVDRHSPPIIKEIIRLKSLTESNNLNPQLTIDQLLIFISKQYKMK